MTWLLGERSRVPVQRSMSAFMSACLSWWEVSSCLYCAWFCFENLLFGIMTNPSLPVGEAEEFRKPQSPCRSLDNDLGSRASDLAVGKKWGLFIIKKGFNNLYCTFLVNVAHTYTGTVCYLVGTWFIKYLIGNKFRETYGKTNLKIGLLKGSIWYWKEQPTFIRNEI